VNRHALEVLEFSDALRTVAARAGSELGRECLLARTPATDPSAVRDELRRVAETLELLRARPDRTPPVPPDAGPPLGTLSVEGGVLDPEGLVLLLRLLQASRELAATLTDLEEGDSPGLVALRALLPVHPRHEEWIAGIVDDEGEIRDDATPALKRLRSRIRDARSRIVQRLEAFLGGLPERIRVPDASVSVRDGRYVIPIRREGRSEVGGVIHGESGTGGTLFVEPPLALQLMNELHELERDEVREVQRILRHASGRLRPLGAELEGGLAALVDFDTLWARALVARRWEAEPPEILDPEVDELEVVGGRHPLLLEQGEGEGAVIPFDLSLTRDERAMVVSGPNTGGKTVFLKALGLTHLLAQAGIVPPVGPGTRLPVLRDVFADIGDEQSIARSLSTFSAHLANAREIVEGAGPGTLVLMDEVGTGTDPTEGAALARAVLESLVERGARAVVTSHLGALKRLDREGSGIVNASLLFDPDRLAPTYRLRKGRPGRSYGLAIARRLGFPGEVLDRAEGYVDSRELDTDRLLESLEERERELTAALAEAEEARDRALTLLADARERQSELERREKGAEARARDEARKMLLDARVEVEEAIRSLREAGESEREDAMAVARRTVEEAARRHREARPRIRTPGPLPELSGGDRVRLRESGTQGVVTQVEGGRATVDVEGIRMELPLDRLEPIEGGGEPAPGSRKEKAAMKDAETSRRGGTGALPDLPARSETDLRGLRVDEVELALGRALDGAVVASLPELRIIHGKGTGAVKARVRELLKGDPRVAELRSGGPGEGGAGVTVAVLR
jgi:DNA mismatch repair protein MutS2